MAICPAAGNDLASYADVLSSAWEARNGLNVEASNVIIDPKCNKGPKCNNVWP